VCRKTLLDDVRARLDTLDKCLNAYVRRLGADEARSTKHLILFRGESIDETRDDGFDFVGLIILARFKPMVQTFWRLELRDGTSPAPLEFRLDLGHGPVLARLAKKESMLSTLYDTGNAQTSDELLLKCAQRSDLRWRLHELGWKRGPVPLMEYLILECRDELRHAAADARGPRPTTTMASLFEIFARRNPTEVGAASAHTEAGVRPGSEEADDHAAAGSGEGDDDNDFFEAFLGEPDDVMLDVMGIHEPDIDLENVDYSGDPEDAEINSDSGEDLDVLDTPEPVPEEPTAAVAASSADVSFEGYMRASVGSWAGKLAGRIHVYPVTMPPERQVCYIKCYMHTACQTRPKKRTLVNIDELKEWLFNLPYPPSGLQPDELRELGRLHMESLPP
jgi:hypothetical protein